MVRSEHVDSPRRRMALVATVLVVAGATLGLVGCADTAGYTASGNRVDGKELFVARCGSCHVLADAETTGAIGPNLDDAFRQYRTDVEGTDPSAEERERAQKTITQVVRGQISYPVVTTPTGSPGMPAIDETLPECNADGQPAGCVDDPDRAADDIAAYVSSVSGLVDPAPAEDD